MPYKNKEDKNAKAREYYHRDKEKRKAYHKNYRANNKEKEKARRKKYREENPDKLRIKQWKRRGIIDGDYNLLNEVFKEQTHCWICWEPYIGTRRKCLDHDWDIKDDGNVRYICCHTCNLHVVG